MLPLYHDPWHTFRFADDRIIPRFHLEGVLPSSQVSVIQIDPESGERLGSLATATVGEGGWVDLTQPITVRAGDAFIAVPITHQLTLTILPDTFAVCRLDAGAVVPTWATSGEFLSITRTAEELSVVCQQAVVSDDVRCERDWRCLQLAGPIPFATVGVLASLAAGKPLFAIAISPAKAVRLKKVLPDLACLYMNRREAAALAGTAADAPVEKIVAELEALGLSAGAITDGNRPVVAFGASGAFSVAPPSPRIVRDVTGAGDALAGATTVALLAGQPLLPSHPAVGIRVVIAAEGL